MQFIKYTSGLNAQKGDHHTIMAKVEINRRADGSVMLTPVSGHTLARAGGNTIISAAEWADSPSSQDDAEEAIWALNKCGFRVCGLDN
ncbi:MAG: hypothetical protein V4621_07700 [Pseudomonadota bacterium]